MHSKTIRVGVAAGLVGGAAEIAWVAGYGALTGTAVASVASGVTNALLPGLVSPAFAPVLGIALHMLLAVGLGVAVVATICSPRLCQLRSWSQSGLVILALAGVWSVNFMLVLPRLDPSFLLLLPTAVTLASKLLFGVGAAAVLRLPRAAVAFSAT